MAKVLVTGCAGFIGSHTVEALLQEGARVVGIDSFNQYYSREQKEQNLAAVRNHERFQMVEGDLTTLDLAPVLEGCDSVIHLAGQGGVRKSWGDFALYVRNNILATQRLLAASQGVKKFVYASSSSVYGNAARPFIETARPQPVSPYGVTKLAAEHLCTAYQETAGIPVTMLRYFTVYGPRQRPDMAFSIFIRALLEDKPIQIFGTGHQSRSFTYVGDVVTATLAARAARATGIFNVGGGEVATLHQVVKLLEDITGKTARVALLEEQQGDVLHTEADTTKAAEVLGFTAQVPLKEGLAHEVTWLSQ